MTIRPTTKEAYMANDLVIRISADTNPIAPDIANVSQ